MRLVRFTEWRDRKMRELINRYKNSRSRPSTIKAVIKQQMETGGKNLGKKRETAPRSS